MADLKATSIRQMGDGKFDRVTLPKKTAAEEIEKGDFLVYDGTGVTKMSAVTGDATFVGVSGMDSADADGPQELLVYTKCICVVPAESFAFKLGTGVRFHTNGTVEQDQDTTPANTIAWSIEHHGSAVTSLKVLVDVVGLQKLFGVEA